MKTVGCYKKVPFGTDLDGCALKGYIGDFEISREMYYHNLPRNVEIKDGIIEEIDHDDGFFFLPIEANASDVEIKNGAYELLYDSVDYSLWRIEAGAYVKHLSLIGRFSIFQCGGNFHLHHNGYDVFLFVEGLTFESWHSRCQLKIEELSKIFSFEA